MAAAAPVIADAVLGPDQPSSERCIRCGALNVYSRRSLRVLYRECFRCETPLRSPWQAHGAGCGALAVADVTHRIRIVWARLRRFDTHDGALDCTAAVKARCDGWGGLSMVIGVTEDVRELCGGDPAAGVPKVMEVRAIVAGGREITRSSRLAGDARLARPIRIVAGEWRQGRDRTSIAELRALQRVRVMAASVGDPTNPAGAVDVTSFVQMRIDTKGAGTCLLEEAGSGIAAWLPDPLPGRPKKLRIRYRCWGRDLETTCSIHDDNQVRGAEPDESGTPKPKPETVDVASKACEVHESRQSRVAPALTETFASSVVFGYDEGGKGAAVSASVHDGSKPRKLEAAAVASTMRLLQPLRIVSPRVPPRLFIDSASWGHPTQPSGAYDVTPRIASLPFELAGVDSEDPPVPPVREVPHPDDEPAELPGGGLSAPGTALESSGEWLAGGASSIPRADWFSLPPETDLHVLLGDPFRTLGKQFMMQYRIEPRAAAARAIVRHGHLLCPLSLRAPVVGPVLQVRSAVFTHGGGSALPVSVAPSLRQLVELQGGFQLCIGKDDDAMRLLGLQSSGVICPESPSSRGPGFAADRGLTTPALVSSLALAPQPLIAASAGPKHTQAAAAARPSKGRLVSMRSTPLSRAGRAARQQGGSSAVVSAHRREPHAGSARQIAASSKPVAVPTGGDACGTVRFVTQWRDEYDAAADVKGLGRYFGVSAAAASSSHEAATTPTNGEAESARVPALTEVLPAEYGRGGPLQATGALIADKGWGQEELRRLGRVKSDGEEGAVARRLLGALGGAGGRHSLQVILQVGQRKAQLTHLVPVGSKTLGAVLKEPGLLPEGMRGGELRVVSDAAVGAGGDSALRIMRATITPEDGEAALAARTAAEGAVVAPEHRRAGDGLPGHGRSNAAPAEPPPSLVDVSARLRGACRMTRDGLCLSLPAGFLLAEAIGELPFPHRETAFEVHWVTPPISGTITVPNIKPGPLGTHIRAGWAPPAERLRSKRMATSTLPGCPEASITIARCGEDATGAVFLPPSARAVIADGILRSSSV